MRIADSTAFLLTTGSEPGKPRQTAQTWVFGSAPNAVEQPQNIFEIVLSSTCTSSPSTGSYAAIASSYGSTVIPRPLAPEDDQAAAHPTPTPGSLPRLHQRDTAGRRRGAAPSPAGPPATRPRAPDRPGTTRWRCPRDWTGSCTSRSCTWPVGRPPSHRS